MNHNGSLGPRPGRVQRPQGTYTRVGPYLLNLAQPGAWPGFGSGAGGVGLQLAQRLVADGETVLDVPPKLSTRARIFDRGHGRKNDPGDARTVAVVALRTKGLLAPA
jgi:hypothetical protein